MKRNSYQDLGTYAIGDRYPYPYFVFTDKEYDSTHKRLVDVELDPTNYTAIKFCARHESNNQDVDDHTKDDIYANLTSDGNGVYHYVFGSDEINKAGKWYVRIEFERSDGKKFHHEEVWFFDVTNKMPGRFGDL